MMGKTKYFFEITVYVSNIKTEPKYSIDFVKGLIGGPHLKIHVVAENEKSAVNYAEHLAFKHGVRHILKTEVTKKNIHAFIEEEQINLEDLTIFDS